MQKKLLFYYKFESWLFKNSLNFHACVITKVRIMKEIVKNTLTTLREYITTS